MPAAGGEQRLCLHHAPAGAARAHLLFVHPFAEEMNKSRRQVALTCRALAERGVSVLQIDLRGCGDSSADFRDASWDDWLDDIARGVHWLQQNGSAAPLWLWGLRAGALLATAAAARHAWDCNFLLWQPVTNGKQALQQFLRLKVAAELAGGASKGVMEGMKQTLQAGGTVEVAGYGLGAALAHGLEAAQLLPPAGPGRRLSWLEVSTQAEPAFSPVSSQALQRWREAGWQVDAQVLPGPSFWASSEIETAPALIERTVGTP